MGSGEIYYVGILPYFSMRYLITLALALFIFSSFQLAPVGATLSRAVSGEIIIHPVTKSKADPDAKKKEAIQKKIEKVKVSIAKTDTYIKKIQADIDAGKYGKPSAKIKAQKIIEKYQALKVKSQAQLDELQAQLVALG